jgi:predicted DCC family thiol-disulfide oxidoreductase YuxK
VSSPQQLLVYDGDCGFCTSAADWISRRWPESDSAPLAVPWQNLAPDVLGEASLSQEDVKRAAWWIHGAQREEGSRAVGRALIAAGKGWAIAGRVLLVPPISWIAPLGYRLIARYRYRLPGGTPACKV